MRLAEYSLHCYRLRYRRPVRWSDIVEDAAPFVLLRLQSDSGATGVAEITVKPTWCGVTAASLIAILEDAFMPLLATLDLNDPMRVRAALDGIPENGAAKALIDNACWDLYAAQAGCSLWRLWSGQRRVELSFALTRQAPSAMAAEAEDVIARHGFRTLKVKGGQGIEIDRAAMREIRAAVGDQVRLYVDANGAYSPDQALAYVCAMAECGAVAVEDPCVLAPDRHFRKLQQDSPVPILVDFGCASLRDAALFLEQEARALSIKPGRFGLSHARAMQTLAREGGAAPVVGLMGESALGTLCGLQFAAALPEPLLPAELTWFLAMTEQITRVTPTIADGAVDLPEDPSLAPLIDWHAVRMLSREQSFTKDTRTSARTRMMS
jgi:L-alanine-DL-glutamate epimerase-like enolase superfamily enzyme